MAPFIRSWSPGRFRLYALCLCSISLLLFLAAHLRHRATHSDLSLGKLNPSLLLDRNLTPDHGRFWAAFQPLLDEHAPGCPPLERGKAAEGVFFNPNADTPRPDLLRMRPADVATMRARHAAFLRAVRQDPSLAPAYRPGTRGIVTTAGGKYLPVFAVSLRMLRRTGCALPVEVFLADAGEYEPYICDVVFAHLGARCVVLSAVLRAAPATPAVRSYQFKPLAMLFSSFEHILFLDADAFPLRDPDDVFDSPLYRRTGLITFPDFWASSASPLYYAIAAQPAPPTRARASTESGEIFLAKRSHRATLLLATYYNYYGPTHYYPLLSQGAAGEGDKETFLAAAAAAREPAHQVSERIAALGRRAPDGSMVGSAMLQADPLEDAELTGRGVWRVKDPKAGGAPRPFFVHANVPKFNPATILKEGHAIDPVRDEKGRWTRPWTIPEAAVRAIGGVEFERLFWSEIRSVACEYEDKFESWRGERDVCRNVTEYYEAVFGGEERREEEEEEEEREV